MSIAIVIPENWEPAKLVCWSTKIARARNEDLLIIRPRRLEGPQERRKSKRNFQPDKSPLAAALQEQASDFTVIDLNQEKDETATVRKRRNGDRSERYVFLRKLKYSDLVAEVLKEIRALRVKLLIVPRHRGVRHSEDDLAIERQLFREVPCETLLLRPGKNSSDNFDSILVATSGSKNALPALNFGATVASGQESKITALYVEDSANVFAQVVPPKNVDRSIRKSLKDKADEVTQETVIDRDIPRGVRAYAAAKGHDVVVVGAGGRAADTRRLPASVPEQLMSETDEPTVVVVRNALPLADRVLKLLEERKKDFVPQLDREGRIELVARLQSSANWDFDFMFLIFLATLLASLGLMVDSAPVVIGAMLVAPLMSPMLGLGLSVVQGNRQLGRKCIGTIARGFSMALLTACAVGILRLVVSTAVTQEMTSRGAPGVLDLCVAFVSGVVAAYAFGRPHLLSVIPGIAIATSLVPPVATAGLALISLKLDIALGATLLFLSNFVAIVLGSAASLWVVGMRGPRETCATTAWERRWVLGFLAASACLAVFFAVRSDDSQLHASPVAAAENQALHLSRPAEVGAARPLDQQGSSPPSTASNGSAEDKQAKDKQAEHKQAEDKQAEHDGEIRFVLKPPAPNGGGPTSPEMTIVIPSRPRFGNQADPGVRPGQQKPSTKRRRPLLRILRRT